MKRPEEDGIPWKATKKPEEQACDNRNLPLPPYTHTHNRAKFNPVVENKGTGMMERNDFFLQKSKSSGGDWYFCLKKLTVDLKANKKMFQGEYLC